jgi:hypothetical protein
LAKEFAKANEKEQLEKGTKKAKEKETEKETTRETAKGADNWLACWRTALFGSSG